MTACFSTRWASFDDLPALRALMALAIDALQARFLSPEQIAASHAIMGLDTQLVEDGTYLIVEQAGVIVGCGGWSRRATFYGGDHSTDLRAPGLLDPARNPARIRAMYTHPVFARQGIGRLVLSACEQATRDEGFSTVELVATLSGEPLYTACGYVGVEWINAAVGQIRVSLVRMQKVFAILAHMKRFVRASPSTSATTMLSSGVIDLNWAARMRTRFGTSVSMSRML